MYFVDDMPGARAFFYASASMLLVSYWLARSKASVTLTTGTFAELAKDPSISRAEALRRALMPMLDAKNPPDFAPSFRLGISRPAAV